MIELLSRKLLAAAYSLFVNVYYFSVVMIAVYFRFFNQVMDDSRG